MKLAEHRYDELASLRDPFLVRARACAALTVPHLMPPDGHTSTAQLPTPYQSVGARGVNNLSVRILLALLPPNSPFFKLQLDDFVLSELSGRDDVRAEFEEALSSIERAVQGEVEASAIRVPAFEAVKQLINSGNILLHIPKTGNMRAFRLDTFVCKRDPFGNPLEIVLKESISPSVLPEKVRKMVEAAEKNRDTKDAIRTVDIYTYIQRLPDKWIVWQEVKGHRIGDSFGTYPLDRCPWLPLCFTRINGEDYGRSYVEQYLGDLKSLEGLTKSIVEGSAAAAKVLFLIKPNSTTRSRTIAEAPNGAIREGNAEDVTTLQMEKFNDFRVALDTITRIEQRLEFAFLLTSAIQRSGERVTAEEIRRVASDLEVALGGVYALLSQEFQLPLVNLLMARMQSQKRLPKLPKDKIKPTIVTGLEALGRGNDNERLVGFMADLAPFKDLIGPRIKVENLAKRVAASRQIDIKDLFKSDEEMQQEQAQNIQQQLLMQTAPNLVNQGGALIKGAQEQAAQPAAPTPGQTP
jgi:hypothetical protein